MSRTAVILLSGGLDSATTAAIARSEGFELYALSIDYGQRHRHELAAAKRVAQAIGVCRHEVLAIDLTRFGASALTDRIDVPKDRDTREMGQEIPVTYVPARNTVMLSLALAAAESIGSADIFIGANAVDYSGYPDCRAEYLTAFETMANLATKASVQGRLSFKIHAPLVSMTKAQIIGCGVELGVDYSLTHSCYDPTDEGRACGRCDSCRLRREGFHEAGLSDPLEYFVMNREDQIQYLANIYFLMRADGEVVRTEDRVFEDIARQIGGGYIERKRAIESAKSEGFDLKPIGRWSEQIGNLEDLLFAAYCDGTLDPGEKRAIQQFASHLGINQEQFGIIKREAKQRYSDFQEGSK